MKKYLKNGMDRIEFRNQMMESIIGQDENGNDIKLMHLSKSEVIKYLEEHLIEIKEDLKTEESIYENPELLKVTQ